MNESSGQGSGTTDVRGKVQYLLLALVGTVIASLSAYGQWISMDFNAHTIAEYISSDLHNAGWWAGVGVPFIVGLIYLGTAAYCIQFQPNRRSSLILMSLCLVIGCGLAIASGFGYFAAITTAVCLAIAVFDSRAQV
jgi:hypothetical protein